MNNKISRRTMLISGSTALMLPILESNVVAKLTISAPEIPRRLVFLPMGYGVNAQNWLPSSDQPGTKYVLPPLMDSFADLKPDISFIQNLSNRHKGAAHDGSKNWLTCANLKNGNSISCDQLAAEALGRDTRHSSLALAGKSSRVDGHGGFASWGPDGKPVGLYRNMTDVYTTLFGTNGKAADLRARLKRDQSSLDAILGNAKRLQGEISAADRDRVDEYFTSIRNIEKRLAKAQDWADTPHPEAPFEMPGRIDGIEEIRVVLDMMHAALQSDSTRVLTYMLPTHNFIRMIGGSNPHRMSHKGAGDLDPDSLHQKRDRVLAELVSGFVRKLKETKEADGSSLLDHTLVAYGSALRQGHAQSNGPLLLAGQGGGGLKQGQNIVYKKNVSRLSDLWLSMLRQVGVEIDSFADSQGVLTEMGFE